MPNFYLIYHAPNKGWWANYRWHITEPSEKLGLKNNGWEKVFFRSGWQGKVLEIENIEGAKKVFQALQNGTIVAFGGRFRGASYDQNAERMIKQVKRTLKVAIKRHAKGENINVEETAVVPSSYYNWGKITLVSVLIIFVVGLILYLFLRKRKKKL